MDRGCLLLVRGSLGFHRVKTDPKPVFKSYSDQTVIHRSDYPSLCD